MPKAKDGDMLSGRRAPRRFPDAEHVLLIDEGEPESFEEAKEDTHSRKWLSTMQDEMDSLHENHIYELVELPKGKRALRNKWVYKLKPGDGRNTPRYKAPEPSRFGPNLFGVLYLLLRLPVGKGIVLHEDNVPTTENFLVDRVPHSVAKLVIAIGKEYARLGLWI